MGGRGIYMFKGFFFHLHNGPDTISVIIHLSLVLNALVSSGIFFSLLRRIGLEGLQTAVDGLPFSTKAPRILGIFRANLISYYYTSK